MNPLPPGGKKWGKGCGGAPADPISWGSGFIGRGDTFLLTYPPGGRGRRMFLLVYFCISLVSKTYRQLLDSLGLVRSQLSVEQPPSPLCSLPDDSQENSLTSSGLNSRRPCLDPGPPLTTWRIIQFLCKMDIIPGRVALMITQTMEWGVGKW